jgi:hypothetical protein
MLRPNPNLVRTARSTLYRDAPILDILSAIRFRVVVGAKNRSQFIVSLLLQVLINNDETGLVKFFTT